MIAIKFGTLYESLWDKVETEYRFIPDFTFTPYEWISLPGDSKKYYLPKYPWTVEQEKTVNGILKQTIHGDIYAMDWHHECFMFNPNESFLIPEKDLPFIASLPRYYDKEIDDYHYFPSYYPNGDYFFFISTDWSYGIFGHPWLNELYVMGKELIEQFDLRSAELEIRTTQEAAQVAVPST